MIEYVIVTAMLNLLYSIIYLTVIVPNNKSGAWTMSIIHLGLVVFGVIVLRGL